MAPGAPRQGHTPAAGCHAVWKAALKCPTVGRQVTTRPELGPRTCQNPLEGPPSGPPEIASVGPAEPTVPREDEEGQDVTRVTLFHKPSPHPTRSLPQDP